MISESLAWDIALSWRESLRNQYVGENRVVLVTDRAGVDSHIVKSYQWVKLDFRNPSDAARGRASVIAWFWLTCCPGYSGLENPQFWKRVFCELGRPPVTNPADATEAAFSQLSDTPITDAIRFFDVPDAEFPRILFDYVGVASRQPQNRGLAFQSFLGLSSELETTTKLREIFTKLQPHLMASRMQRQIPVALHEADARSIRSLRDTQAGTTASSMTNFLPRFEFFSQACGRAQWSPELTTERTRRAVPNYFQSLFADAPGPAYRFSRVRLERDRLTPNLIERVCSIAPQSRNIDTLHLKTTTHRKRYDARMSTMKSEPVAYPDFSRMDWAWIGYALFHPEASGSALRDLKIGLHGITREAIQILKLMKTGNHLHAIAAGSLRRPTSKYYHTAQLREGSIARRTPSERGEAIAELHHDARVTLCVDDVTLLAPWVRVVVPGLGLAWIRASDIVTVSSQAPSTASIKSLRVAIASSFESSAALAFVRLVGADLHHLDISMCADLRASSLRRVLEKCPRLSSLRVKHDGSLWTGAETETLPMLEELSLTLEGTTFQGPSQDALRTSLRKLSVLRVVTHESCFNQNQSTVQHLLEIHFPIEYFHWSDPSRHPHAAFAQGLAHTRERLNDFPLRDRLKLPEMAFLSVLRSKRDTSTALGRLNRDVSAQILEFAKSRTMPNYWVGA